MKGNNTEIQKLSETVIKGGYCIGCGACASLDGSPFKIEMDEHLMFQARLNDKESKLPFSDVSVLSVCPFSNENLNENEIGKDLYGGDAVKDDKLGYVRATYAGYVVEDSFREKGSSGGMGTWILTELFTRGLIDGVAHVHAVEPTERDSRLFKYHLSTTIEEIVNGAKSRYYPIEMSEVVKQIKEKPGKYAIVGLPCFIKAIRLLMLKDQVLSERIKFCIGLVCGHLKSAHFANMWAWQVGIHPTTLIGIDFRTKLEGYGANQYGITATGSVEGERISKVSPPLSKLFGANWGWGLFKYKACDYCDDVVAETADVTIGDAWLPRYVRDSAGTNIIIIRNRVIQRILEDAESLNRISMEHLSKKDIIASQSSGFAHRRESLSFRLFLADTKNKWRPQKRVEASEELVNSKIKKRQELRIQLAEQSHILFNKAIGADSFQLFVRELQPLVTAYQKLYRLSLLQRLKITIKRKLKL
ncbi:Coenzyme F420 hydrogenase/dehydrogenase, beta subunit C-terminal domain [Mariniphaga sediminis]|uniref:Coenzyme F420 hydrogenase/dehydrogenase, beta subunit C-terminal domain n=1 Tax=Mariniphaga sediminis TaxID=1628158 RepID=UPI0035651D89